MNQVQINFINQISNKHNLPLFAQSYLQNEINCVSNCFSKEINVWKNKNLKINLLILAEAPLSCHKYFYNHNPGIFLSLLKTFYTKKGCENISKTNYRLYFRFYTKI